MDIKGTIRDWIDKQFIRFSKTEVGFMLEFSYGVAWTAVGAVVMVILSSITF